MTDRLILNCIAVRMVVIERWVARFPQTIQVSAFYIIDMKLHRFASYHISWQSWLCMYMIYVPLHSCIPFSWNISTSYVRYLYLFSPFNSSPHFLYFFFFSFFIVYTHFISFTNIERSWRFASSFFLRLHRIFTEHCRYLFVTALELERLTE